MKVNSLFLIVKAKITATALHRREETETECYNCALIQHLGSNIISFSQESKDYKNEFETEENHFCST